jgi:putative transposase
MREFRNKYRIPSARMPSWDYSTNGLYYITVCTFHREMILGKIENHEMVLSAIGVIVMDEWNKSFQIRRELFCDVFVIMPDHLHAILRIHDDKSVETHGNIVETHGRASLQPFNSEQKRGIAYRSPKSISSFVACFKSAATKHINEFRDTPNKPVWQPRFHDHIIRNDAEYQRIRNYIIENPLKYKNDDPLR